MDAETREWCESEARRALYAISVKEVEKKRTAATALADEEMAAVLVGEDEAPPMKEVKPLTLKRPRNEPLFHHVAIHDQQSNDSLGRILSSDEEDEEEIEE